MSWLLSLLLGALKDPVLLGLGLGGSALAAGILWIRGKLAARSASSQKQELVQAIAEHQEVAQKEAMAKTPEDVYAALKADRASRSR